MNMIYKKSLKDFWATKSKTFVVMLTLFIGVFGLSVITFTSYISKKDLEDNFLCTNPASVILPTENLKDDSFQNLRVLDFVDNLEVRPSRMAKIRSSNKEWMSIILFGIASFEELAINTFEMEEGSPPKGNEIVIERDGLRYLDSKEIKLQIDSETELSFRQSGTCHAPGLSPSHMDHIVYGFITIDRFNQLFKQQNTSNLLVTFKEDKNNLKRIHKNTSSIIKQIEINGGKVTSVNIPKPGEHPHQGQLSSLLFLQFGIGGLAILLSLILLINVIFSIMSTQIKQIGIMKAVGGSYRQITTMYLLGVGILSVVAIILAIPLAYKVSLIYSGFIANQLNFNLINTTIPFEIISMLVALSLFVPLLVAFFPIRSSVKMTVKSAINNNLLRSAITGISILRASKLPLWLRMSIDNLFKNKKRLIISIFNLGLGIALIFIAYNVSNSLRNTFAKSTEREKQDISVVLDKKYSKEEVLNALGNDADIAKIEVWERGSASFKFSDSIKGKSFSIVYFQENTELLDLSVIEGEIPTIWDNSILVNTAFLAAFPSYSARDSTPLIIGNNYKQLHISGVVKIMGAPTAYMSKSGLENLDLMNVGKTQLKIKLVDNTHPALINKKITHYENKLAKNGINSIYSSNMIEKIQVLQDHILVILYFLIAMSVLVLLVVGLGVVSAMNISIIERKREIGIMRAIGGKPFQIRKIITVEMLMFGILSWGLFWLISIPISKIISDFFGQLIIETKLDYASEPIAVPITFIIMLLVIALALVFPLRKAKKMTIKEAIVYE